MIKLEFNGRPFDPQTFEDAILKAAMESVAEQVRDRIESIRHPDTGEFPTVVVSATSLDDIKFRIEGSPALLELVKIRMDILDEKKGHDESGSVDMKPGTPKVFLSYAWEDSEVASRIAHALQNKGIQTWWAEWCISAGDSLRQKIDEGLGDCSHFVVVLSPNSLHKPWVNQEMDAGLTLRLQSQVKFIPLRHNLSVEQLPPLLRGMLSPSVDNPEKDIQQLISDIYGLTRAPVLGKTPESISNHLEKSTGYSIAANAIARLLVSTTKHARKFDPQISVTELASKAGLSDTDAIDALHELRGLVTVHSRDLVYPEDELFVIFDAYWMSWNPEQDALKLAVDMQNDNNFPTAPAEIGARYNWDARRLNPAMAYLVNRNLVRSIKAMNGGDWLVVVIQRIDATRRFVKSRS